MAHAWADAEVDCEIVLSIGAVFGFEEGFDLIIKRGVVSGLARDAL